MGTVGTLPQGTLAKGLWPRTIEELLAFIGVADKQEADLSMKVNDLFRQVGQVIDGLVVNAIEKRTAVQFSEVAAASFNDYVRVLRAKSDLLQVVLHGDRKSTERLVNQSLSELEGEFRNQGAQRFGGAVSEQAIFTVWTVRKTAAQIWKLFDPAVVNLPLPEALKPRADKLGSEFALYSAWAGFHLECLTASMRLQRFRNRFP